MLDQPSYDTPPVRDGKSLFDAERLQRAAWAFTTRRVPRDQPFQIRHEARCPQAGDLVLARVDLLGHHRGLQLRSGRKKNLFPGDEIVLSYGNRYAPSQFEAIVPKTLGPCQLVAGGGVAAKALSWHSRISRGPTLITPIGLLIRPDGERANLRDHALEPADELLVPNPTTIAVVGTSMDTGKSESAAFLVNGLIRAGLRVGFAKVTGTGAGGDTWLLTDAGADPVLDFTDAGLVSTHKVAIDEIERVVTTLMAHLTKSGIDAIVMEVADGVLQAETAALLESELFGSIVSGVLFTAQDAMGAVAGAQWLKQRGIPIAGISGVLTAAPLQRKEASEETGLQILSREDLARPEVARRLLAEVEELRSSHGGVDVDFASAAEERELAEGR
ncbi:MAG: DUF1611 domain-containing protein [Myxococcales bacterium]|nr:DUF1611 domain-containing protein [Myxococcales bacterium]